jgi:hypothetical protein
MKRVVVLVTITVKAATSVVISDIDCYFVVVFVFIDNIQIFELFKSRTYGNYISSMKRVIVIVVFRLKIVTSLIIIT